jgi:hypothetical protein
MPLFQVVKLCQNSNLKYGARGKVYGKLLSFAIRAAHQDYRYVATIAIYSAIFFSRNLLA